MPATTAVPLPHSDTTAASEPFSDRLDALLRELARQPPGPRRTVLRDQVIHMLLPLVRRVSRRFRRHGEDLDDLVQVASVGLIKAVDGYDPDLGHAFLSYALPKLTGEIRRHLRDRTTAVRLPRSLQEASGPVFQAVEELEQRLGGGSPTPEQIAEHTGMEPDRVLSTLRALHECRPRSLDEPARSDQESPPAFLIGSEDAALGRVVDTVALVTQMRQLPERDRRVLYLRFYQERTQQQIADVIGVSQMQVSRILRRCLGRLRDALLAPESEPCPAGEEKVRRRPVRDRAARSPGRPGARLRTTEPDRLTRSGGAARPAAAASTPAAPAASTPASAPTQVPATASTQALASTRASASGPASAAPGHLGSVRRQPVHVGRPGVLPARVAAVTGRRIRRRSRSGHMPWLEPYRRNGVESQRRAGHRKHHAAARGVPRVTSTAGSTAAPVHSRCPGGAGRSPPPVRTARAIPCPTPAPGR
ncbi:sigma-70 family RNA polymerase sigma factor [Streptomyces sp. NPDC096046]|uniref:sigma-70 family RNA polymerase sigma factor n=1 Tax=Streptomyces sp. NPDC096046 TaxID=3155542 RepID=UPI0033291FB3